MGNWVRGQHPLRVVHLRTVEASTVSGRLFMSDCSCLLALWMYALFMNARMIWMSMTMNARSISKFYSCMMLLYYMLMMDRGIVHVHHVIIFEAWSRGDQAMIWGPRHVYDGLVVPTLVECGLVVPILAEYGLLVPVLESTGMGMHRRLHTLHYR